MKSIIVRLGNGVSVFSSGNTFINNEDGTQTEITLTGEEELQSCYQSLISEIRRGEFEKGIISVLENHLSKQGMERWKNIQIKMSFSKSTRQCEFNITNKEFRLEEVREFIESKNKSSDT